MGSPTVSERQSIFSRSICSKSFASYFIPRGKFHLGFLVYGCNPTSIQTRQKFPVSAQKQCKSSPRPKGSSSWTSVLSPSTFNDSFLSVPFESSFSFSFLGSLHTRTHYTSGPDQGSPCDLLLDMCQWGRVPYSGRRIWGCRCRESMTDTQRGM